MQRLNDFPNQWLSQTMKLTITRAAAVTNIEEG